MTPDQLPAGLRVKAPATRDILLSQVAAHIHEWHIKYGQHNPDWLPPAGGVALLEAIDERITKQALSK